MMAWEGKDHGLAKPGRFEVTDGERSFFAANRNSMAIAVGILNGDEDAAVAAVEVEQIFGLEDLTVSGLRKLAAHQDVDIADDASREDIEAALKKAGIDAA